VFCSSCGRKPEVFEKFCTACGAPAAVDQPRTTAEFGSPLATQSAKAKTIGFNLTALILGGIALLIAIFDYSLLSSGDYAYIADEEVGLLFILSATSLGFAIAGAVKDQRHKAWALSVSIVSMLLTLSLTNFMLS
jgi:hypothetical protein